MKRTEYNKGQCTHGLRFHPLYYRWNGMISRCYNTNDPDYESYGGRGITVCDEWRNSLQIYIDYISNLPDAKANGLSIDRIDNAKGYCPGNLRWATRHTQMTNSRLQKNNTTGYRGVSKSGKKFVSYIKVHGERVTIGYFTTKTEAVNARNEYIIDNKLFEYEIQALRKIQMCE